MNPELNSMIELLQKDQAKFSDTYLEENISYTQFQSILQQVGLKSSEKNMWKLLQIFAKAYDRIISEKWVKSMVSRPQFILFVQNKHLFFDAKLSDADSHSNIAETMQKIMILNVQQVNLLIEALKKIKK